MTEVEIEYCVPCGLLDHALEVERNLLKAHGGDLDAVTLRTGHGGVFQVAVDGNVVYDKADEGFDLDLIQRRVAEQLAPAEA